MRLREFTDLGSGIPLFFYMMKYIFVVYLLIFCVVAIPGTILCSRENKADQWPDTESTLQADWTIGNFGKPKEAYEDQNLDIIIILNTIVILLVYLLNFLYRNFQR